MSKKGIPWEETREALLSTPEARAAYEAEEANPTDDLEIVPVLEKEVDDLCKSFDSTLRAPSDR